VSAARAPGFTAATWQDAPVFVGRIATPADADSGAAVFALADTGSAEAFSEPLPQPAIWYDEDVDEDFAVLIVQAERHETEDGELLDALGLLLPDGRTAVAFVEDVEEVSADDAEWLELIAAEHANGEA
jgi:hypothetical protein